MIGENLLHIRSHVHVSGCISVSYIDLNPVWISGPREVKEHYTVSLCVVYFANSNSQHKNSKPLYTILHRSLTEIRFVWRSKCVYAIHSGNKCDVLSDEWLCFFDHNPNNLHGIIQPSYFTFTTRWNSRTGKKNCFVHFRIVVVTFWSWTCLLYALCCVWNRTTYDSYLV